MALFQSKTVTGGTLKTAATQDNPLLFAIVDNFPGGICVFDNDQRMMICNERLKTMLDYTPDLFEFGMPTLEQIYRYNARRGEYGEGDIETLVQHRIHLAEERVDHVYERTRPNGTVLQIRGVPLEWGGFLTLYFDVTEERRRADGGAPVERAGADVLAGRSALVDRLEGELIKLRPASILAVHCMDIDGFAAINAKYGRDVGDSLLASVSDRLRRTLREEDAVARISGDRFIVLQANVTKPSDVFAVERRLVEAIRKAHKVGALEIPLSAAKGVALAPRDGLQADMLVARAEEMMLRAKQRQVLASTGTDG